MDNWLVIQSFLSRSEEHLIRECFDASKLPPSPAIKVSELGRYGKSGARLLKCLLSHGRVFVVKIGKKKKIIKEYKAMNDLRGYFPDIEVLGEPPCDRERGALLYRHKGGATAKGIKQYIELHELVYDLAKKDNYILDVFHKMWECFDTVRQDELVKIGQVRFHEQYEHHLRKDEATGILRSMFGNDREKDVFLFLGAEITNPISYIESQCFKAVQKVKKGPVHGDLHPNNVVIDNLGKVHLLDYAWAGMTGHVLIDYVLMECSLRFLHFPHHVDYHEQLMADTKLLDADGASELQSWSTGSPLQDHYRRLGTMLREIRTKAGKFLCSEGKDCFLEYLAVQLFVLFGQMTYPDYNRFMVARTLGLIAHKLQSANFGQTQSLGAGPTPSPRPDMAGCA